MTSVAFGQVSVNDSDKDLPIQSTERTSASTIVKTITANKTSEPEKFEAIFNWVAKNISYDYRVYYSPNGSTKLSINKILKKRSGICLGYATLMDTLCNLAGITNVTILGYLKDDIFDVHDSVFADNHAWNAVKLNGLWHLYDVTNSAGSLQYEYTYLSRLFLKIFGEYPTKFKRKKLKGPQKQSNYECSYPAEYYYKQRFLNSLFLNLLAKYPLNIKRTYKRKVSYEFYLTDPQIFAITHYPNNSIWTLLQNKTLLEFESDSSFYHLNKTFYSQIPATGVNCLKCDSSLTLSQRDQLLYLRKSSLVQNKRNRFISAYCEFNIAENYFTESLIEEDVDIKLRLIDSSLSNYKRCVESLQRSKKYIELEYVLQRKKNIRKKDLLISENKIHSAFIKQTTKLLLTESRRNRILASKVKASVTKLNQKNSYLSSLTTTVSVVNNLRKINQKRLVKVQSDLNNLVFKLDSLSDKIENERAQFDLLLNSVVLNVWQKGIHYDSLIYPFRKGLYYRTLLKDNFKKEVVDVRKRIPLFKNNYALDLDNILFQPSIMVSKIGNEILTAIDHKTRLQKKIIKCANELAKYQALEGMVFADFIYEMQKENQDEYCWLDSRHAKLTSTYMGFDFLKTQQRRTEVVINFENSKERLRLFEVEKELKRRKRKHKHIVHHNRHVTKKRIKKTDSAKTNHSKQHSN